jgi:hypothetical protein
MINAKFNQSQLFFPIEILNNVQYIVVAKSERTEHWAHETKCFLGSFVMVLINYRILINPGQFSLLQMVRQMVITYSNIVYFVLLFLFVSFYRLCLVRPSSQN